MENFTVDAAKDAAIRDACVAAAKILAGAGVEAEHLDEVVHDCAASNRVPSREASVVNNQGMEEQLFFLVGCMMPDAARHSETAEAFEMVSDALRDELSSSLSIVRYRLASVAAGVPGAILGHGNPA